MRKQVAKRALLKKQSPRKISRGLPPIGGSGQESFYQKIVSKSGKAKVCVIRKVGGIGDVLMVTPALRQLKRDFKSLHLVYAIDMHTSQNNVYHELMKNCPFVDELIDARHVVRSEYDAVVDVSSVCLRFERSELPDINRVDLFARAMSVPRMANRRTWYQLEESERQWAGGIYRKIRAAGKAIVVLHTASFEEKRCWPIEKYLELITRADAEGLPIEFVVLDFNGKHARWSKYQNVTDASWTDIRQAAALIAEADLFIGPDSGPMHIAGALDTRSLVLFGSVPPGARINYYTSHEAIRLEGLHCLGCWYKPCPIDTKCMKDLDANIVFERIKTLIGV